jgi:myo-inositol catabolism protein IolH
MVRTVAELGYGYIELSPRDDFMPFFPHPRADDGRIAELRNALRTHGVKLSSVLPLYKWSSPDETERQAAVRYWKRMIEITADLECPLMNSEFNGRPERAAESEAAFRRSLEELLPLFEREGIALNLEAHSDDFCEENTPAVDLVRAINKPWVNYLYCAPHSFHLSGAPEVGADIAKMMRYSGDKLQHVHIADSFNHKGSSDKRYILNPPGPRPVSTSTWTSARARSTGTPSSALRDLDFDGVATACVLAWEERARESSAFMLDRISKELGSVTHTVVSGTGPVPVSSARRRTRERS